jgi:hypothetical protein
MKTKCGFVAADTAKAEDAKRMERILPRKYV